jgi:enoyl-CoA hydratase/carnithine racemase
MTPGAVQLESQDHVATIRLNRPDSLNALSGAMADEVAGAFRRVSADQDVWAVVLSAAGQRAFCVGADLKERSDFSLDDFYTNRNQIRELFAAVREMPQPTIAAIFGFTLGGGFELALSCDVVVAGEKTEMGLPEPRVGLVPGGGGTQLLARRVGVARAKEAIFSARRIEADQALEWGIVAEVVAGRPEERALQIAMHFCEQSPVALRETKRAIDRGFGADIDEAIGTIEQSAWESTIASQDRAEGIKAFNEKREPQWHNR